MNSFLDIAEKASRVFAWIGGGLIIASAVMVTAEVFLRKIFNVSLGGADEISGYAFGVATSFGLAYALFQKAHIRVDVLYHLFPAWLKAVSNFVGITLLAGFVSVICVTAWQLVADTIAHNSHSITPMRTPLAIPQIPWLVGWLFFLFCSILIIIAAFKALLARDLAQVEALIGTKSIDERVEEESA